MGRPRDAVNDHPRSWSSGRNTYVAAGTTRGEWSKANDVNLARNESGSGDDDACRRISALQMSSSSGKAARLRYGIETTEGDDEGAENSSAADTRTASVACADLRMHDALVASKWISSSGAEHRMEVHDAIEARTRIDCRKRRGDAGNYIVDYDDGPKLGEIAEDCKVASVEKACGGPSGPDDISKYGIAVDEGRIEDLGRSWKTDVITLMAVDYVSVQGSATRLDTRRTRLVSQHVDDVVDEASGPAKNENPFQRAEASQSSYVEGDGNRAEGGWGLRDGEANQPVNEDFTSLIPGLPSDVAENCIARVPWIYRPKLTTVCKAWHSYLNSHISYKARTRQRTLEGLLVVLSVPVRLGPLRLTVFDATEAQNLEWHKALAVFNNPGKWSGFLRGFRCAVVGPDLFIVGGRHDGMQHTTGKTVWRFNFVTRRWTEAAPMRAARRDFACAVIGGRIYVAGGTASSKVFLQGHGALKALSAAEMYDHECHKWHELPHLKKTRVGCLGVALENHFYVIGGGTDNVTGHFELYRSAEVFDTRTFRWKTIEDMWQSKVKLPRAVAVFDGSLFAVDSDDKMLKTYDEAANCWKNVMAMPFSNTVLPGRQGHAERQQAMGGLPGDQLIDIPDKGLFWMGPCSYLSRAHHLLRICGNGSKRGCYGIVADVEDDDTSPCTSVTSGSSHPGKDGMAGGDIARFKSSDKRSCLVTGSGIVHI